jgi:nucleoside-diphosphate-sugar epimerase
MKIENLLLTGGSGKIGRAVLSELLAAGYRVRATQLAGEPVTASGVEIMEGTLADEAFVERCVQGMDAVIHMANVKENRQLFMDSNVKGTFLLLDAAWRSGHVQQFIQAGSDARSGIYYYPHPIPITEAAPAAGYPGYYPLSKVLEETLCEQYYIMRKFPVTALRFSWVQDEDDIIAHMTLREPNLGVPVWRELATTPEQKRFFETGQDAVACMLNAEGRPGLRQVVGLPDVVRSVMLALGNPVTVGQAFNVSGPSPFSYRVAADYLAGKLDLPVVEFLNPEFYDFSIDMSKSRAVLGFQPEYDIFKILDEAVAFRQAGKERTALLYPG